MRKFLATLVFALTAITACGGGSNDSGDYLVRVDLIDDAVKAVKEWNANQDPGLIADGEDELQFFEINATQELINLYVATDNATSAVALLYDEETGLSEPDSPKEASGSTFKWSDIDSDITKSKVYETVVAELPRSTISRFVIGRDAEFDKLTFRVIMVSDQGGEFAAYVEPSGKIIGGDLLG